MRLLLRFLFGALSLVAWSAWASTCTEYRAISHSEAGEWRGSPGAAVTAYFSVAPHTETWSDCTMSVSYSLIDVDESSFTFNVVKPGCTNSIGNTGGGSSVVDSGTIQSRVNENCNQCADMAGQMSTINITQGWARSPVTNKEDWIGELTPLPGTLCQQGCKSAVLQTQGSYRSQTPSTEGLFRLSTDLLVIHTDQECVASSADDVANPNVPPLSCPGFLGEVNGQKKCVPDVGPGTATVGTGDGSLDDNGNPSAGEKPSSGEGSGIGGKGRTPTLGDGGNAGGPAAAANGGTGKKPGEDDADGKTDKEEGKEQLECGAPGQPKCAIDETGTPTGQGKADKIEKASEQAGKDTKAAITAAAALTAPAWSFSFALPTGCSPVTLAGYDMSLDICEFQSTIHDLMSMVWLICTCIGCINMVGATLRGA